MRIEQSVEIERSPDEIFSFVADPRNDARWAPACEEVQKTSKGPPGVGTTYRQVGRLLGRRFEVPIEITAYEPNRKLAIKPITGPVHLTHLRSVEGTTDGTRLTITLEGQTGRFFRVVDLVFACLAKWLFQSSLANLKGLLETYDAPWEPDPAEPLVAPPTPDKLLYMTCMLWLLNSAIGARVAVKEGLPAEWVADLYIGRDAPAEFFKGGGTALSPGLPMMVMQALFTVLSTRGGRVGKAGVAGLTLLGAGGTVGVLAETITYRVLSPRTFDPAKAPIVSAGIVLSALMAVLGTRRLRALRSDR
jgi:carbon monoxide dehydrogenase subunit G